MACVETALVIFNSIAGNMQSDRETGVGRGRGANSSSCGERKVGEVVEQSVQRTGEGRGRPPTSKVLVRDGAKLSPSVHSYMRTGPVDNGKAREITNSNENTDEKLDAGGTDDENDLDESYESMPEMREDEKEDEVKVGEETGPDKRRNKRLRSSDTPSPMSDRGKKPNKCKDVGGDITLKQLMDIMVEQGERLGAKIEDSSREVRESREENKKEMASLARKIEDSCENWRAEKAELEEKMRNLVREKDEWTEKEARHRREWEKKMMEKVDLGLAKQAESLSTAEKNWSVAAGSGSGDPGAASRSAFQNSTRSTRVLLGRGERFTHSLCNVIGVRESHSNKSSSRFGQRGATVFL